MDSAEAGNPGEGGARIRKCDIERKHSMLHRELAPSEGPRAIRENRLRRRQSGRGMLGRSLAGELIESWDRRTFFGTLTGGLVGVPLAAAARQPGEGAGGRLTPELGAPPRMHGLLATGVDLQLYTRRSGRASTARRPQLAESPDGAGESRIRENLNAVWRLDCHSLLPVKQHIPTEEPTCALYDLSDSSLA